MHFAQIAIALAAVPALAMASPAAAPAGDKTVVARSEPSGGVRKTQIHLSIDTYTKSGVQWKLLQPFRWDHP